MLCEYKTYRAPLIYQSEGIEGMSCIPSLGILKCTISGDKPLCYHTVQLIVHEGKRKAKLRQSVMRMNTRFQEFHSCLPIAHSSFREFACRWRGRHRVDQSACSGRSQHQRPSKEANEMVLLGY